MTVVLDPTEIDELLQAERNRISRFVEDWLQLGPRADTTYRHTETYGELVRRIRSGDYPR